MPRQIRQVVYKHEDGSTRIYASRSYVYFILKRPGSIVKIGFTSCCPFARLEQLCKAAPPGVRLHLLGVIDVFDSAEESKIHDLFAASRKEREWFWLGEQVQAYIRKHAGPHFCDNVCGAPKIEGKTRRIAR